MAALSATPRAVDNAAPSFGAADLFSTPTQETIHDTLKSQTEHVSLEEIFALTSLELNQLPSIINRSQFDPLQNPKQCCFDVGQNIKSWTVMHLCSRCKVLGRLLLASSASASPCLADGIAGIVMCMTDCEAQSPFGEAADLPLEILFIIVDIVVASMRESKDGSTLCAIMHTNSQIRFRATQGFAPIVLFEHAANPSTRGALLLHESLIQHVWDALHRFTEDFSVKRHGKTEPLRLDCPHVIRTDFGIAGRRVSFNVAIITSPTLTKDGKLKPHYQEVRGISVNTTDEPRTVNDARVELDNSIDNLPSAPRLMNPFLRALSGSLNVPDTGVRISITMILGDWIVREGVPGGEPQRKTWRFVTAKPP